MCALTAYVQPVPKLVELISMTALPLQRLYVLKYPLNSHANVSKRRKLGIWFSSGLWIVTIAATIALEMRGGENGVEFIVPRMSCEQVWMRTSSAMGNVLRSISLFLFQIGPLLITSVANIWVLFICFRSYDPTSRRSKLKTKTVVTIATITLLFVLSILPGTVMSAIVTLGGRSLTKNHYMSTISLHLSFINVVSNYYIYLYGNRRREIPSTEERRRNHMPTANAARELC